MSSPVRYFLFFALGGILFSCHQTAKVQKVETTEYIISTRDTNSADTLIANVIQPYKEKTDAEMSVVLGRSDEALHRGVPEGKLGNFVSDVCFLAAEKKNPDADFAFFNNGGLRNPLPMGSVTRGNVYELMPFENEIIILSLKGSTVKKLINFIASKGGVPVSGIRMKIKNGLPAEVKVNGTDFDSTKTYQVVTSDYLANGGDKCFFLLEAERREYLNLKVRDALMDAISEKGKRNESIHVELDGRIVVQ